MAGVQTASPQTCKETINVEATVGQIGTLREDVRRQEHRVRGTPRTFSLGNASLSSSATLAPALAK